MASIKSNKMNWLKFAVVEVVLFSFGICFAAEPNHEQPGLYKTNVLREEAQNWIKVGLTQFKRGLYEQAEKSFITAQELGEHLSAQEHKELQDYLVKVRKATIEKQEALEHLKKAQELVKQGQPIEARAHYEKVRNSQYLTEQQRKEVAGELKKIDNSFDRQKMEITQLYNRSVEFYKAGELEKARDGFVEVARYGLLTAPEGQTAEDYLIRIDSILTDRLKNKSTVESAPPPVLPPITPPAEEIKKSPEINQQLPAEVEITLLKPGSGRQPPVQKEEDKQQPADAQKEVAQVVENVGTEQEKQPETVSPAEAKKNIARIYTKAVVDDAASKVEFCIKQGEFDKAVEAVRAATQAVRENRPYIGEDLFIQHTIRLKQLADKIINIRKKS
jgi:tetratricopeptide (TPR) repeat protein